MDDLIEPRKDESLLSTIDPVLDPVLARDWIEYPELRAPHRWIVFRLQDGRPLAVGPDRAGAEKMAQCFTRLGIVAQACSNYGNWKPGMTLQEMRKASADRSRNYYRKKRKKL